MEAIRKIVTVKDNVLKVALPEEYNNRRVELIILPASEEDPSQVNEEKADYFTRFYGRMHVALRKMSWIKNSEPFARNGKKIPIRY